MSEQPTDAAATDASRTDDADSEQNQAAEGDTEQKPTETVEFWKAKAREQEKRAKANADAQKRLEEIEAANMSELEKAKKQAEDSHAAAEAAKAEVLRYRIAAKHGITDEDAELFLTGTDEDTLNRQAGRLADRISTGPKPDPTQGTRRGHSTASTGEQFAAALEKQF